MTVKGLHHYTLRCDADELALLRDFYVSTLGLTVGDRPSLRFAGHWLYAQGHPIVHLYASGKAPAPVGTGLDHVAFEGGDLTAMRDHLSALGVHFDEAPVPGWPMMQLFVKDPLGLKVEITFAIDAPEAA